MRPMLSPTILAVVCGVSTSAFAQGQAAGAVSGHVYEEDGVTPIADFGVLLQLVSGETAQTTTYPYHRWGGPDDTGTGAYTVDGLPVGRYSVTAAARGHVNQTYDHTTVCGAQTIIKINAADTVRGIDFALQRGGSVAGQIRDAFTDAPLAGIAVCGWAHDRCAVNGCSDPSDDEGRYVIAGAFPRGRCTVSVSADDTPYIAESGGGQTVSVVPPDTTRGADFRLTRGGAISGAVRSSIGSALGGIPVTGWVEGGAGRTRWTGTDGRFLLQGLPSARYYVAVTNYLDPSAYHWRYYRDTPRRSQATLVQVSGLDTTSGVDLTLVPVVVDSVRNEYLRISVSDRFPGSNMALAASGGLPGTSADDGKDLLFGYPQPHTSFTTVLVDGRVYVYGAAEGDLLVAPHVLPDGKTIERVWGVAGIRITQTVSLVSSTWSDEQYEDTAALLYTALNTDTRSHRVGFRILLDTMLGTNDGAPIKTYSDYRETERVFVRYREPGIPPWWKAMEGDPRDPIFVAQGTLSGWGATEPDKVVVGLWTALSQTLWNYEVRSERRVTDSAVGMWWNPTVVAPDSTVQVITYYGLGEGEEDVTPPYGTGHEPTPSSVDVPAGAPIAVRLRDADKGVDRSTIRMWVNGDSVAPAIVPVADSASADSGKDFLVTYAPPTPERPPNGFRCNQTVTVEVQASDLAWVPNVLHRTDSTATYSFRRVSDTQPPYVVDQYPAPGAEGVPLDATIRVSLRDDVAGVMSDSLALSVDGVPVTARTSRRGSDSVLRYTPPARLRWNQRVRVAVGARDWAWPPNVMAPHEFSFTTVADAVAPVVTPLSPLPRQRDVARDAPITLHVSDDGSGLALDSLRMEVLRAVVSPDTLSDSLGTAVSYTRPAGWAYEDTVDVNLRACDRAGNCGAYAYWFVVGEEADPPYCTGREPAPNTTGVPASTAIVVRLRDAGKGVDRASIRMWVNGDSVAPAIAPLTDALSTGAGKDFLLRCASSASERPANGFRCNQTVTVEVEARDLARVPNVLHRTDSTATYTFRRVLDTQPPYVVDPYPAPGAVEVALDGTIRVSLRDDVAGVMSDSLAMSVDGVPVAARRARRGSDWVLEHTPAAPFGCNQTVRVAVRAQDWAWPPNAMVPHVYSFTTMADTVAPVVLLVSPGPPLPRCGPGCPDHAPGAGQLQRR
ncbi:MAG: Ig-like domain-containing protein [Candidatus Latescibacterota bacterium]